MKIHVVVNPTSAAGHTRRKIPQLRQLFEANGAPFEIHETRHAGHATELALHAVQTGAELVVAVGGDGTFSEVVQGLPLGDAPSVHRPALGLVPCGTGGDLRRSLGLSAQLDTAVKSILHGAPHVIDVGGVEYTDASGCVRRRRFVNVASLGVSARVSELVNHRFKWLGGRFAFYGAAVCATANHTNQQIQLRMEDQVAYEGPAYLVAFANGRYFGGGMQIAPRAELGDGNLDCVLMKDFTTFEALGLSRRIYRGTHLAHAKTQALRGRRFEVQVGRSPKHAWALDLDGEVLRGFGPLRFTVLPGALVIRGASPPSQTLT